MKIRVVSTTLLVALSISLSSFAFEKSYPVAGLTPWQRPVNAPVVEWVEHHDQAWYQRGLTGIAPPYPKSLYFMDNQGNWYTPFTNKGMPLPYDLRGWHQ